MFQSCERLIRKTWFRGQWILMVGFGEKASKDYSNFTKIIPPKDRFWADPFFISRQGKYYLFIEELRYKTEKGHISVMELSKDGTYSKPKKIIEKPYHLSYPFLFEFEEKLYMIPESWESKTIQLYECVQFPFNWKFKMNLMSDISAADTTLHFQEGKWWLFTSIDKKGMDALDDQLYLFYADNPITSNWKAHPKNPIISDISRARPAGNLFFKEGKLMRPSQDCSKAYGYAFNFNEIETLSETDYKERLVEKVKPDWEKAIKRTHTYNCSNGLTVIDAQHNLLRLDVMVHSLR